MFNSIIQEVLFTETFSEFQEQTVITGGEVWTVHGELEHCPAKLLQEVVFSLPNGHEHCHAVTKLICAAIWVIYTK